MYEQNDSLTRCIKGYYNVFGWTHLDRGSDVLSAVRDMGGKGDAHT